MTRSDFAILRAKSHRQYIGPRFLAKRVTDFRIERAPIYSASVSIAAPGNLNSHSGQAQRATTGTDSGSAKGSR